ncbi:major capsid protein [uncultured Caudovirales phage]|uniref:Major capsid protein n=1 Tax=uncultured Caudovirales phage TaxID=2100421 RepID=A0A6J5KUU0_9CAUD|nr:major capsid protein [uncultured Caudovirales phage]
MELNQLFEGSNNYKSLQADAARLSGKWAKSGLLEGISNEIERNNMSMILENQAKQIVSEASQTGNGAIGTTSGNAAGGAEQWAGVALPLVRKVFAQIAAKDFVSVQPMNLPSGLVFYLDFKYGTATNGRAANENIYGNVSTANSKMAVDQDVAGGLYGAGQFGYSINSASYAGVLTTSGSAVSASIGYNQDLALSNFFTLAVATSSLSGFDIEGVRAFRLQSASVNVTTNPEFTFVSQSAAGAYVTFVVAKAGDTANNITAVSTGSFTAQVKYQKQPSDTTRGDFEDNTTNTPITIPEINVSLASEAIVAKTRKLKAQWTPEFAQDLNAYHSIDAEAELTSLLSEYISMEIDLELMDMLIQDAATTERWSAANNKTWTGTNWSTTASAFYNTQGQWFGTLGTKVQKVSNKIHQKTLRGGANFLVCSPSVATILESIPGYAADTNGDKLDFAMGVQKVGNLNSRFRVYKNPYMTENVILLGYRGSQFLETGAVYAPYIPLIMTPLVYDPVTFTPRKGIMTRYAKKMIRPEFYGKIFVSDLTTV